MKTNEQIEEIIAWLDARAKPRYFGGRYVRIVGRQFLASQWRTAKVLRKLRAVEAWERLARASGIAVPRLRRMAAEYSCSAHEIPDRALGFELRKNGRTHVEEPAA